ncbi:MAG: DUF3015 family protein [Desulfobacula sp.]|jgi:hypothetical protein|nr:DUF3015 family protein [Desulfobacula sp.]MBT7260201.1 DUF3015 family protein [Desulfobacula sp.]
MSKIIKVLTISAMGLFLFSQMGLAREFADIYTECGIGAMIAPRNTAVAAVTNVTWDSGTTAISSNISCPDSCNGGQEKVASFIYESYESIEKDLAKGNGNYLDNLLALTGYDAQAKKEFIIALRSDFKNIVADPSYTDKSHFEKAEGLYNLVYNYINNIS